MAVDSERIKAAVSELLAAIGEDPARPGLANTPARVAQAYGEFFAGLDADPAEALGDGVPAGEQTGELVLMRGIDFRSICEHHLLPFTGVAHVAYVPAERLAGLGRLARVVDVLASRPQLQERLTDQITDVLEAGLDPHGVLVVLDAQHDCVSARGPRAARSTT
ncbi:MAG: GTP cyclohydrolase I, partial [Actinomycetota bacterium]|nr:GTP cyclohydrolase I [Actinomycetota bacterium]